MTHHPVTESTRHLTASAVVLDPETGMVLLVAHRASGKLQFPGGHIDAGEDPGEAALREVLEETGVEALLALQTRVDLPGMKQLANPWLTFEIPAPAKPDRGPGKPAEPPHHHIDQLFIGIADSRNPPSTGDDGVSSAVWVPVHALTGRTDVRAEVPDVARIALAQLPSRERVNTGISITGAGSVTISGSAFGPGATVTN